jgi:hypothetical protein
MRLGPGNDLGVGETDCVSEEWGIKQLKLWRETAGGHL